MRKIVCLATSPWYPIPTRKQQVMSRIPDAEILYFDPSITYIAPIKDKAAQPGLTNYKKAGVHPQENITVYALPPVLPLPSGRAVCAQVLSFGRKTSFCFGNCLYG